MKRLRLLCILCVFGVWPTLAAQPALAKGPFFGKIVVSGPGLNSEVTITDQHFMESLAIGELEDFSTPINAPQVGEGYELVRYFELDDDTFEAFDHLTYYPNALVLQRKVGSRRAE